MDGRLILTGMLLVLLATFANALSLDASADHVILQGTEGRVTLTALNDLGADAHMAFSANLGEFTGAFDTPLATAAPLQTVGTVFRFRAPDAFEGVKELTVTAHACTTATTPVCKTATKRLTVTAYSSREPGTRHGRPYTEPVVRAPPANTRSSTVVFAAAFPATAYEVDLSHPATVTAQLNRLERVKVTVANRGAARTFDLAVSSPSGASARAFPERVTLQRGEAAIVFIDVVPNAPGAHGVKLFVSADGRTVPGGYAALTVRVPDQREISLRLNADAFAVAEGEPVRVRGAVVNDGTRAEDVTLKVADRFSTTLTVPAHATQPFELAIDSAQLGAGAHVLRAVAESGSLRGEGAIRVTVEPKAAEEFPRLPISVTVRNTGTEALRDVTGVLTGIPEAWVVTKPMPFDIEAGGEAVLAMEVERTTDEAAAAPVLLVKSGEETIERIPLKPIESRQSSLTGLFIGALNSNLQFIAVLLVLALIVVMMYSRLQVDERETYLDKLRAIRTDVNAP